MLLNGFSIFISYNPLHRDKQIKEMFNSLLTLSDYSHAFQFGIDWDDFIWNISKLKYENSRASILKKVITIT